MSITYIHSFSEADTSLCEQDANLTQFSDELHMPLGTPLSSPCTVRRKQAGRHSTLVMSIGEKGFNESDSSDSNSSDESEEEEEVCEYETQSESESESNSEESADSVVKELEARPDTTQDDKVQNFESVSSLAACVISPLIRSSSYDMRAAGRPRVNLKNCSSIEISSESEPECRIHGTLLNQQAEEVPVLCSGASQPLATSNTPTRAGKECTAENESSSGSTSVSSSSFSSGDCDYSFDDNSPDNKIGEDTYSGSISTMSTAEAAAALHMYKVVQPSNPPATSMEVVEAAAFIPAAFMVTSGKKNEATAASHTAVQLQSVVNDDSSDDFNSISNFTSDGV